MSTPHRSRDDLLRWLGTLLVAGGLVAVALRERARFPVALDEVSSADPGRVSVAFVLVLVGYGVLPTVAWVWTSSRVAAVGGRAAASAWLRAATTKYIPGVLWHPYSAIDRLRRRGGSLSAATFVLLFHAAALVASGLLVGAGGLPALLAWGTATPWLLLGVPAIVVMHPRMLRVGLSWAARLTRRPTPDIHLNWSFVARILAAHLGGWLVLGGALALLLSGLGSPIGMGAALSAASLSWVAGFLFLVAPAGLGVREATMVVLLSGVVPSETALAVALIWRMMFIAADMLSVGVSFLVEPMRPSVVGENVRTTSLMEGR